MQYHIHSEFPLATAVNDGLLGRLANRPGTFDSARRERILFLPPCNLDLTALFFQRGRYKYRRKEGTWGNLPPIRRDRRDAAA